MNIFHQMNTFLKIFTRVWVYPQHTLVIIIHFENELNFKIVWALWSTGYQLLIDPHTYSCKATGSDFCTGNFKVISFYN